MITEEFYEQVTGDEPGEGFEDLVADVVARLEGALNRPIPHAERTEWVSAYKLAHPAATPITAAGDWPHTDVSIAVGHVGRIQVTYSGGWLPQNSEAPGEQIPDGLARAIAWGAHTLLHPAATSAPEIPADVQSMSVAGEFSVTRKAGELGADGEPISAQFVSVRELGGRCAQLAAPYRRIPLGV